MKTQLIASLVIITICMITWRIINKFYSKFFKEKNQIHMKFFKNFLQTAIVIIGIYQIGIRFENFKNFSETILTSSSLLVVVLGFAFQTSLEDFIAGIFISIFKPFNINDRVTLTEMNISGYIEDITIRHTVIRTFNNNRLIIPNSKMNKEVIENTHLVDPRTSGFMDVLITYDSNVDLAKLLMAKIICSHPLVIDQRTDEEKANNVPQVTIYIRELADDGISLRGNVTTENIDLNFKACSEIRETILKEFKKNNIEIAYKHMTIDGKLDIDNSSDNNKHIIY